MYLFCYFFIFFFEPYSKYFAPADPPAAPPALVAGQIVTDLADFVLPGDDGDATIDYSLIDWEVLERCFNQMDMLKKTHNCYEKNKKTVFDQQSCLANGCLFESGNCFYCDGAYQNMLENARSKKWIKSATDDVCVIDDGDKLACPDYEETPMDTLSLKRLKILNPDANNCKHIF